MSIPNTRSASPGHCSAMQCPERPRAAMIGGTTQFLCQKHLENHLEIFGISALETINISRCEQCPDSGVADTATKLVTFIKDNEYCGAVLCNIHFQAKKDELEAQEIEICENFSLPND